MSDIRHFLDLDAIAPELLRRLLDAAHARKSAPGGDQRQLLAGRILAMVFEKPSTRTRASFEVAISQLGGSAIVLDQGGSQLGRGESIADTARVLSRYVDVIMLRTDEAEKLHEMAAHAAVPVINGLTDFSHPCQVMADIMTVEERLGPIADKIVTWCGDGNNVAHSWIHAAVQFGFELRIAGPAGLRPKADILDWAKTRGGRVEIFDDAMAAAAGADCIVTDTWLSMGDEDHAGRYELLAPFQVTEQVMAAAKPGAIFLHCLPAHRGEEVTAGVIDGPQSAVWDEAENRLHFQKEILLWCLGS